jgi:RNA polymerase sigma-B factor
LPKELSVTASLLSDEPILALVPEQPAPDINLADPDLDDPDIAAPDIAVPPTVPIVDAVVRTPADHLRRAERRNTDVLLRTMHGDGSTAERVRARASLIEMHLPLAKYFARKFRNRGEPYEDLVQVATVGLIKSIDGFDTGRGVEFASYAMPTIVGELKRHFRDKGWSVRVPRRLQELKIEIASATMRITQQLGRSPTVSDLARELHLTREQIVESLEASNAYSALSLYAPIGNEDEAPTVADMMGEIDRNLESVEDRESLRPLLRRLPVREQRILAMRFFGNMTQTQIADEIGVSQMHVSRLLSRSLAELRTALLVVE